MQDYQALQVQESALSKAQVKVEKKKKNKWIIIAGVVSAAFVAKEGYDLGRK